MSSEFGYIPDSPAQSFHNNKGIFTPTDIYNLDRIDKWTKHGQLEWIETLNPSNASHVELTTLGDYDIHLITLNNFHTDDNKDLNSRVLVGGSEKSGNHYGRAFAACAPSYFYDDADAFLDRLRHIPEIGSGTGECLNGYIYMYNALDAAKYTFFTQAFAAMKYDGKTLNNFGGGIYQQSEALSGIKFYMSSGNILSADVSIYGIKEYS